VGIFRLRAPEFFVRFGFKEVEREGRSVLMFKNHGDARPPELILSPPDSIPENKKVEFFWSTQCPYSWWVAKLLEKEFGKSRKFALQIINTDKRGTAQKFRLTFGLRVNGKTVFNRMPSWDEVKKTLDEV